MVYVRGCISAPLKDEKRYDVSFVKSEEKNVLQRFKGVDVLLDHDKNKVIGKVIKVKLGLLNEIIVEVYIPPNKHDEHINFAIKQIYSGKLKYMSVRYAAHFDEILCKRMSDFKAIEISLVYDAGFDNTRVTHFGNSQILYSSFSGNIEILKNMSKPMEINEIEMNTCSQMADNNTSDFKAIYENKEFVTSLINDALKRRADALVDVLKYKNDFCPQFDFAPEDFNYELGHKFPIVEICANSAGNARAFKEEATRLKPFEEAYTNLKNEVEDLKKKNEELKRMNLNTEESRRDVGQPKKSAHVNFSDIFAIHPQNKNKPEMLPLPDVYRPIFNGDIKKQKIDESKI